jgi:NADPH:quinone reductase-like Zn-dependent oxidoreductase
MRAIQISSFGNPTDVLELIDIPEHPQPDAGQALIGVEFAPVNHNDLLLIRGTFHWTPSLPYLVGNEGVGRVLAVGPTVSNVKVGDRVVLPIYSNTWQERVLVSAHGLAAVPPEADVQQLSMVRINPTAAALMLSEYVDLKPGDWVIQNPSNSGVGRAVIAFGKARGLRLINLVRRQEDIAAVEAAGGEVVLVDDERVLDQIAKVVGDGRVRLALDGLGGAATARLASALSQHGELVGYSFMAGYAAPGDFRPLMNKDITLHSFYEGRHEYDTKIPGILREATALIAAGTLHVPIAATYPLTAIKEAVAHAERGGGKVLLDLQKV